MGNKPQAQRLTAKPQEVTDAKTGAGEQPTEAAKPAVRKTAIYRVARKLTGDDKLPKQAKILYDVLAEAGKAGLERDAFAKACEGKLETKQPISRIIGYYQAKLETMGAITIEKKEVPA